MMSKEELDKYRTPETGAASADCLQRVVSGDVQTTLRVLWRTSGFLSGLAQDIKSLSPERAQSCRDFVDAIEAEARRLSANDEMSSGKNL